jgi:hypothetical protein
MALIARSGDGWCLLYAHEEKSVVFSNLQQGLDVLLGAVLANRVRIEAHNDFRNEIFKVFVPVSTSAVA